MSSRAFTIRRPPGGPRAALVALGALVVAGGSLAAMGNGGSPARVSYASVLQGDVVATVGAAGNVQSGKIREVGFGTSGTVTKVRVKAGQVVKAGTLLAELDATQAQEQVNASVAALAAADEAYAKAGTTAGASPSACSSGKASGKASAGATTRSPRPAVSPSRTATARPTATPIPQVTPTPRPSTSASPGGSGGGSSGGSGKSGTNSCGSKSGTSQSQQSGQGSGQQGAVTTKAQANTQVVKAQVALAQARRALNGTRIEAPIAGTVLTVTGAVGSQVSGPGSSGFITIGDLQELQTQAKFSQTEVAKLKIGQAARITLATRPGQSYDGTVTHIDPAATTSGTLVQYGVMIAFDHTPKGLLVGQTATAQVTVQESDGTLYVPAAAVTTGANGYATVRIRRGTGTTARGVRTGVRGDAYVEIQSGLAAGDRVVLPG